MGVQYFSGAGGQYSSSPPSLPPDVTARLFAEMTSARRKSSIQRSHLLPAGGGSAGEGGGVGEGGRGPMAAGTWWSEVGEGIDSREARVPRISCDRKVKEEGGEALGEGIDSREARVPRIRKGEGGEARVGQGGDEGTRAGVDEQVGTIKVKNVNSRFIVDDCMY